MRPFLLPAIICFALLLNSCSKNDPAQAVSNQFISSIRDGKPDDAYKMTTPSLRAGTTPEQFKAFIATLGLDHIQSIKWFGSAINDSSAYSEGQIVNKDTMTVPIKVHLVLDSSVWKVAGVERIAGFGLAGNISEQYPSDAAIHQLVASWLLLLDKSIKANDFSEFYSKMSSVGQKTSTKESLTAGFQDFVKKGINVAAAMNAQFSITQYLSSDVPGQPKILLVESAFATTPAPLRMTMKFYPEAGQWKLLSMNVNI